MKLLAPGTAVGGYQLVRHIATGGMGSVYEVRNRITGEARALKVMRPELAEQSDFVQRFIREIRLAMSLEHPNLVRVYEPGMDGETVFLPMELLEGENLSKHLKRHGVLDEGAAVQIVIAVGTALQALHDHGIVHRDIKPTNVFLALGTDGSVTVKVLDLGAARTSQGTDELTGTGISIGSPHYMAPEQAAGAKFVDFRADQYSVGVMLYQMLTAARPYENDDTGHALAKLLANTAFPAPRALNPQLSPRVEAVILRAMARGRDERFPSMREMLAALGVAPVAPATSIPRVAPAAPEAGSSPSTAATPQGSPGRGLTAAFLTIFILLCCGAIGAAFLSRLKRPRRAAPAPTAQVASALPAPSLEPPSPAAAPPPAPVAEAGSAEPPAPSVLPNASAPRPKPRPPAAPRPEPRPAPPPCIPTPGSPCL